MKANERFYNLMKGKSIDRLPAIEWAPWWNVTVDRWYGEGLPARCKSVYDIQNYFGLDKCCTTGFGFAKEGLPQPAEYGHGIIKNEADYERILPYLYPDVKLSEEHIKWLKKTRDDGDTIHNMVVNGFFWCPRELFGIEAHLYSFYDEGDLYKRICSDYAAWLKKVFEYVGNTFKFDYMSFSEDMSYNNGPMLSKSTFDEFLAPFYKEVIPILKKMDVPVFIDSDGDITLAVDWYAEVGADGMFPLERQAGVDVSLYIEKQPHMTFLGHFDKMCMKFGEEAMRKEFERLLPSMQKGKVIPSVDHQTPPDVSIENYRTYVKLLKEYTAKVTK